MIVTIAKQFTFDAAHFLPGLPVGHKCGGMHGHTYRVELQLTGDASVAAIPGFLLDYDDVAKIWMPLHIALDHKVLNEVPGLSFPSTERLVEWVIERLLKAFRAHPAITKLGVRVSESSTTYAEASVTLDYLTDLKAAAVASGYEVA